MNFQKIQFKFTAAYPFLRIDFFELNGANNKNEKLKKIASHTMLQTFIKQNTIKTIKIDGEETVAAVIKNLQEILDLNVIIFRKSGNLWIETSLTKNWTLTHQNNEGKHISGLLN